ncbi:hypothetical protein FA15DRAFT_706630 [Coprinopsis marcescibilis]|uniref:F-box domain-containing protein n=1 Tax=Coprinopsis marcescibilis TaxID=230819 RepID=A0A5C3KNY6_COPMA|nr:hypothetical protein FA15DRAFT_706630 [Coprinopsis marcescibilis]
MNHPTFTVSGGGNKPIPPELLHHIVGFLSADGRSLQSTSLSSSHFRNLCQEHLFSEIGLPCRQTPLSTDTWSGGICERLTSTLQQSPRLATYIRSIVVHDTWIHGRGEYLCDEEAFADALDLIPAENIKNFTINVHRPPSAPNWWGNVPQVTRDAITRICRSSSLISLDAGFVPLYFLNICGPSLKRLEVRAPRHEAIARLQFGRVRMPSTLDTLVLHDNDYLRNILAFFLHPNICKIDLGSIKQLHVCLRPHQDFVDLARLLEVTPQLETLSFDLYNVYQYGYTDDLLSLDFSKLSSLKKVYMRGPRIYEKGGPFAMDPLEQMLRLLSRFSSKNPIENLNLCLRHNYVDSSQPNPIPEDQVEMVCRAETCRNIDCLLTNADMFPNLRNVEIEYAFKMAVEPGMEKAEGMTIKVVPKLVESGMVRIRPQVYESHDFHLFMPISKMSASSLAKGKGKEVKISLAINRSRSSSTTTTAATDTGMSFDVDYVPEDIWLTIFEQLPPSDLGHLSATCRKFHHLTQRPLLREITWAKTLSTRRNVRDWAPGNSLAQFTGIVRKVKIRLSFKKVNNGALVSSVDWDLYDAVFSRIRSFSNLRSLELMDTIITPALYPVLAAITSLRELTIIRCVFVWSPLYPAILETLGRPLPAGYPPHGITHGIPPNITAQEQWFAENHNFDFAQELSHITHLTFKYNRLDFHDEHGRAAADDFPHPSSELNKPSILHPLYLLTIPSLTDLTLTWTPNLIQVYDILRRNYNFSSNPAPNAGIPGGPLAIANAGGGTLVVPAQIQFPQLQIFGNNPPTTLATLMNVTNPFGHNPFVQLRPDFTRLRRVTLLIDDLSRDVMDSVVGLFERRDNSLAADVGPLRILLKVGKHTLTEQHIGNIQFRLPGVYRFEGPLPIVGLLNAGSESLGVTNTMEEIRMTEAMDMGMILHSLEKLPRTMNKLDLRMFKWDGEILYAVRSLFKGLKELVIRYGKGHLPENNHVVLGSDILPELKDLHTLRLLPSPDCIKRERSLGNPYNQSGGYPNTNWWAMSSVNLHNAGAGNNTIHPHHHHHQLNHANNFHNHNPHVDSMEDDDTYDPESDEWSDDTVMDAMGDTAVAGTLQDFRTGSVPYVTALPPGTLSSTLVGGAAIFGGSTNTSTSASTSNASHNASDYSSTGAYRHSSRSTLFRQYQGPRGLSSPSFSGGSRLSSASSSSTSTSSSALPLASTSRASASSSTSTSSTSSSHIVYPRRSQARLRADRASMEAARANNPPVSVPVPRVQSETDRIAASLREDLGDYLVGWNRHCPSLRVVQIEHDITWIRRFDGDMWTPAINKPRAWEVGNY